MKGTILVLMVQSLCWEEEGRDEAGGGGGGGKGGGKGEKGGGRGGGGRGVDVRWKRGGTRRE